jgi:hypothetical protein
VQLFPSQEVLHSCIHSKVSTNFNMDRMNRDFADGGTFHEVYHTSNAVIGKVPLANWRDQEVSPFSNLPRTRHSTNLNRFAHLDRVYFTCNTNEKAHIPAPSRSSSSSGEEVVFRGRACNRRTVIERVSEAFRELFMAKDKDKNELGCYGTMASDLSDDHSTGPEDTRESRHSGDVRGLIAKPLRPSPVSKRRGKTPTERSTSTKGGIGLPSGASKNTMRRSHR